jgi:hypothetical protein
MTAGVVEHHRDLLGDLEVLGDLDPRDRPSAGIGVSPIWKAANMPLGTLTWLWRWA